MSHMVNPFSEYLYAAGALVTLLLLLGDEFKNEMTWWQMVAGVIVWPIVVPMGLAISIFRAVRKAIRER